MLTELLAAKRKELDAEQERVDALLRECSKNHENPAKDYWHTLNRLRGEVRTYERAIAAGVGT